MDAGEGRGHVLPVGAVGHDGRRGPDPEDLAIARGSTASCVRTPHVGPDLRLPAVVDFIAETCTLEPGDLILTGTPSGVGMSMDPPRFLASGDVVRIEIERLGAIEHAVA